MVRPTDDAERALEEMGYRLGLKPWEINRATPAEIRRMWDGFAWRQQQDRSREANTVAWLRSLLASEPDYAAIRASYGWPEDVPAADGDARGPLCPSCKTPTINPINHICVTCEQEAPIHG